MSEHKPVFIACGVFRREVEQILREEFPDAVSVFPDSMLHMHPEQLRRELDTEIARHGRRPVVLVYGDCHAYMQQSCQLPHCTRTAGMNCCELLLGHEQYRQFQRDRVFIFLPEWTYRWREVFARELGLADRNNAGLFMKDMHSALVYLDTGISPVPEETLRDIETYFDMPVSVRSVSLDMLRNAIRTAAERACT